MNPWKLATCCVLSVSLACASAGGPNEEVLAFVGGTIVATPEDEPLEDAVILVRGGRIEATGSRADVSIPPGASEIDCSGLRIFAGFQNSHVHFTEPHWRPAATASADALSSQLEEMLLSYGFTTVVDTGSWLHNTDALRQRIESGEIQGPRILTAGTPLYPENGIPFYLRESMSPEDLATFPTPTTPEEAAEIVARQLDEGADLVKLFTGSWVERGQVLPMDVEIARAAADAAHARNALVFTHASSIAGLEVALEAGVDVVAHALDDDRGWSLETAERMKAAGMTMVPTLKLFDGQPYTKFILLEIRDLAQAEARIAFGTDVGYLPDYDTTAEYTLMAGAGLDWRQILESLTTAPAELFGEGEKRGRIAPGLRADLVALGSDPAADPAAFADVVMTVRDGRVVYRAGE